MITSRSKGGPNLDRKSPAQIKGNIGEISGMQVHPEGRIIDPKYRWMHEKDILDMVDETIVEVDGKKVPLLDENKEFISRFIHDARMGKTLQNRARKKVQKSRQVKYLQDLKKLDAFWRKPFDKVDVQDMERFVLSLEEGRLTMKNGKPYASETVSCIKKIVIKFYSWLYKDDPEKIRKLVGWIDTSYVIKDKNFITLEQLETMMARMASTIPWKAVRNRAIAKVLFDCGCRVDELTNIRMRHLSKKGDHYMIFIEFPKADQHQRTNILPLSTKELDEWLAMHPLRDNPEAQLFMASYSAIKNLLARGGEQIGVKVTPHTMRRSCTTHWASHLTHAQICYRLGWSMNSKQPARYIQRAGLTEEKVVEIVEAADAQAVAKENRELKQRMALLEEEMARIRQEDMEEVRRIIAKLQGNQGDAP